MKAQSIRNALEAHGWVGLILSIPLFIIFWAGAITLFHPEMEQWAKSPHYPVKLNDERVNLNRVVEETLKQYQVSADARISLRLPDEHSPYLTIFFRAFDADASPSEGQKPPFVTLAFDPYTGEQLYRENPFELAHFLYELHYNLKLPQGSYIVGIVTLFFLVLIFTGLLVQLKKLVKHFFMYRSQSSTRYQMNDMHNVVGVISLPYGLMYAVTGLMFNLGILLQAPAAIMLYQGDIPALTKDAGVISYTQAVTNTPIPMTSINDVITRVEARSTATITSVNLHNYGDETAVYRLVGLEADTFASRLDVHYAVKTDDFPSDINIDGDNTFTEGTAILFSMHFGNFAGVDLRILYFVLAIGVCAMIVAGNVLWIVKRQKRGHHKTIAIMRGLTVGGCMGVITATAIATLLERVLPVEMTARPEWVQGTFAAVLAVSCIIAFMTPRYRCYVGYSLCVSTVALIVTFIADIGMFGRTLLELHNQGVSGPLGFSLGLAVISVITGLVSYYLLSQRNLHTEHGSAASANPVAS